MEIIYWPYFDPDFDTLIERIHPPRIIGSVLTSWFIRARLPQEYYIRHVDGCTLDSETKRRRVAQCLVAAIEPRASHGLRLDVCTRNRPGLLTDITRAFRENGLTITRAEIGTRGGRAVGSFYVMDASCQEVNTDTVEMVRREIGDTVSLVNKSPGRPTQT